MAETFVLAFVIVVMINDKRLIYIRLFYFAYVACNPRFVLRVM